MDEFPCSHLTKALYPLRAAQVFSKTFLIVLETKILLAMQELLRSELLVLIELSLIHDLSVRLRKCLPF